MVGELLFVFFFSSRRRHTRSLRDWSSDVCSSDLRPRSHRRGCRPGLPATGIGAQHHRGQRSAERRVGKECRSRWSPFNAKKKKRGWSAVYAKRVDRGGRRNIKKKKKKT